MIDFPRVILLELKQQLSNLRQGSNDVNTYYTELRIIWDEFLDFPPKTWCECAGCRCDNSQRWRDHQQQDFVVQFLMGLNDSFVAIRSHFLSLDSFPALSNIFSSVIQEERQKGIGIVPGSVIAPISESPEYVNAAQGYSRGKDKLFCTHCQRTNHTVDKCYQLHGFPPGFGRGRGRGFHGESPSSIHKSVHNVGAQINSDGSTNPQPTSFVPTSPTPNMLTAE